MRYREYDFNIVYTLTDVVLDKRNVHKTTSQ